MKRAHAAFHASISSVGDVVQVGIKFESGTIKPSTKPGSETRKRSAKTRIEYSNDASTVWYPRAHLGAEPKLSGVLHAPRCGSSSF